MSCSRITLSNRRIWRRHAVYLTECLPRIGKCSFEMLPACARAQFLSLLVSLVESLTMKPKATKCQTHWYDSLLLFSSLGSFFLALRHGGLTLASIKTAFAPHSSGSAWWEHKTLFEDTYSHIQVAVCLKQFRVRASTWRQILNSSFNRGYNRTDTLKSTFSTQHLQLLRICSGLWTQG